MVAIGGGAFAGSFGPVGIGELGYNLLTTAFIRILGYDDLVREIVELTGFLL